MDLDYETFHVIGEDSENRVIHEQKAKGRKSLGGVLGFMLGDCVRVTAYTNYERVGYRQIVLRFDEDGFDL